MTFDNLYVARRDYLAGERLGSEKGKGLIAKALILIEFRGAIRNRYPQKALGCVFGIAGKPAVTASGTTAHASVRDFDDPTLHGRHGGFGSI